MKIGKRSTEVLCFGDECGRTYTGTVVYVHPEGRYYTVEFIFGRRRFRESFLSPERRGEEP